MKEERRTQRLEGLNAELTRKQEAQWANALEWFENFFSEDDGLTKFAKRHGRAIVSDRLFITFYETVREKSGVFDPELDDELQTVFSNLIIIAITELFQQHVRKQSMIIDETEAGG